MCPAGHPLVSADTRGQPRMQPQQPFGAGTHPALIPIDIPSTTPQHMSIRDTSAQDIPVAATASRASRLRRPWLIGGALGAAGLLVAAWLLAGWRGGSRSFDGSRVRIATVTRGDLVRDISADGRVIASNKSDPVRDRRRHGDIARGRRRRGQAGPGAGRDRQPRAAQQARPGAGHARRPRSRSQPRGAGCAACALHRGQAARPGADRRSRRAARP